MADAEKAGNDDLEGLIDRALNSAEPLQKPKAEPIRPQGILERIVLSKWTAPVSALASGAAAYYTTPEGSLEKPAVFAASSVIAGLSYITAKLIRQDWLLRKAESVRKKTRRLPSKLLNLVPEHPEIIAGGIAAYMMSDTISSMLTSITTSDFFRHPKAIQIVTDLSATLASVYFAAAYSAASLIFGKVVNPEAAKTLFRASAAVVNARRGRYKEAASSLSRLLEMQRSYNKAVALQTLIGDMQLLDGQTSCIDAYRAQYQQTEQFTLEEATGYWPHSCS